MSAITSLSELLADTAVDVTQPFNAPWEARAFAIALRLTARGVCTWDEFRHHLMNEVGKADKAHAHGWVEPGEGYYTHFLRALENLLREKGIVDGPALRAKMHEINDHDHET
ncbi:MAG TPA: nitrile hydratase accessory protein [Candidatus Binataceae bacterium]|nr:nitrile hydratase accessory protein [Candidatus Binataceae bacterium]